MEELNACELLLEQAQDAAKLKAMIKALRVSEDCKTLDEFWQRMNQLIDELSK